jgi:hypothetical protein
MKGDDVLAQIRDHVRAERSDDAALEAIARGEAKADAVAALLERADGDAELAAIVAGCEPLDDAAAERIAVAVKPAAAERIAAAVKPAAAARPAEALRAPTKVVPFARRAAIYAGPVALAAAVLVFVGLRDPAPSGALLPDYSIVASSQKEMRGADDARPALTLRGGPEAEFEILARPATATGKVVAFAFAVGEGEPNPVDATVELAPEGAVRIRGRARALDGAREVRVVLGTANDSISRYEDALSRARSGKSDAKVRVLVVPIVRP